MRADLVHGLLQQVSVATSVGLVEDADGLLLLVLDGVVVRLDDVEAASGSAVEAGQDLDVALDEGPEEAIAGPVCELVDDARE